MADERYAFTYKCRLCGEAFNDGLTGKTYATRLIMQSAYNLKGDAQRPSDKTVHFAEDHVGIADLVGCKKEGSEN